MNGEKSRKKRLYIKMVGRHKVMIEGAYVQYQSVRAAEDMFSEMRLLINEITMRNVHFISDETAAAVLELALKIEEVEGEA
jgi:hypothetical protein